MFVNQTVLVMRAIFRICGNESQLSLPIQLGRKAGYALELQVYVFKFSSFCLAY